MLQVLPCLCLPVVSRNPCLHPVEAVGGRGSLGALKLAVSVLPFTHGEQMPADAIGCGECFPAGPPALARWPSREVQLKAVS